MTDHYRLLGGPGSPYSLKMRAVLRYRRLAHTWNVPRGYLGQAPELQKAAKGMIPVMQIPEGDYWADTTPPEGFFRYVALPRVAAYVAMGWQIIGETRCPHDGARAAIVEWPAADEPLEPNEDCALAHAARASAPRY